MTRLLDPQLEPPADAGHHDAPPSDLAARSPFALGWSAAKQNAWPAFFLVLFAVSLGLSYAFVGPVRAAFEAIAEWRDALGFPVSWLFPVVSTALFGAIIPWLVQQLRPAHARPPVRDLLYFTAFWGFKGAEIQCLYLVLAAIVGDDASVTTIALKLLLDMGIYCWLWAVPSTLTAYQFRDVGYSWKRLRLGPWGNGFWAWWKWDVMPVVVNNWLVWVPAVVVIYAMPLALQLPFQNLVLCFWALVMAIMSGSLANASDANDKDPA